MVIRLSYLKYITSYLNNSLSPDRTLRIPQCSVLCACGCLRPQSELDGCGSPYSPERKRR